MLIWEIIYCQEVLVMILRGTCEDDYNTYDCYSKSYQAECDKKYNETGDPATIYYK